MASQKEGGVMKDLKQLKKDYEKLGKTIEELEGKEDFDFEVTLNFGSEAGRVYNNKGACGMEGVTVNFSHIIKCEGIDSSGVYMFETEEEAEISKKKEVTSHKLRLIANHLNGCPEHEWIDWEDEIKTKYSIFFNELDKLWGISETWTVRKGSIVYFKTRELAEKAIEYLKHYNISLEDV